MLDRTFSPSKFLRNEIRNKYYPFGKPKFGRWKNGRCGLYIFGGKNSESSRAMRVCRVNKTDGKINGGMMIPRFLFWQELKVTFFSTVLFTYLSETPIIDIKE